uniref:C2H2-type domain-containing protein n=1 Tax=Rhabditophanes sp. KR3021 TaxID=114890 RepID=A0AC35TJJ0_9BILA
MDKLTKDKDEEELFKRYASIIERSLIAATKGSTNLSAGSVSDRILNLFTFHPIKKMGHYFMQYILNNYVKDKIEKPARLIFAEIYSKTPTEFQCLECKRYFSGQSCLNNHLKHRSCKGLFKAAEEKNLRSASDIKEELYEKNQPISHLKFCDVYLFANLDITEAELNDPKLARKYILYVGESVDIKGHMGGHMIYYNRNVKWEFLFDDKERAVHKVFAADKEMLVLKKTYASEDHAMNIRDILIDYCSDNATNCDSGKSTYYWSRKCLQKRRIR